MLDSGASAIFISEQTARELQLKRHQLHAGQPFTAASGDTLPCTEFVHIYVRIRPVFNQEGGGLPEGTLPT